MLDSVMEFVLAGLSTMMAVFAGYHAMQSSKHKSDLDFAKEAAAKEQDRAESAEQERDSVKRKADLLNAINEEAVRLNVQQKEALDEVRNHPVDRDAFDNNG